MCRLLKRKRRTCAHVFSEIVKITCVSQELSRFSEDQIFVESHFPFASTLKSQSCRSIVNKRIESSMHVGDGGIDSKQVRHTGGEVQQQDSASSASAASADRGGNGRVRSTQDVGMGRRRTQSKSSVAGAGTVMDSSEDIGAGRNRMHFDSRVEGGSCVGAGRFGESCFEFCKLC